MSRYRHHNGANNEHYDIDLQSPFAADTLGDYGVTSVTRQGVEQDKPLTEVTEQGAEESSCLEGRCDIAGDTSCCGFRDTKVLLEACAGNRCTNKSRIIPKARMVLACTLRHLERKTCSKDPVAIINASEYKRQL